MLEEGRISPALASAALDRHRASGDRFEEALLACGLPESMLLRHLAEMFNTRYISSKTLSGALVPRMTLSRLPRRLAERYQVLPIRFADDDVLTVVATEPANPQLLENVRVAAGARLVTALVARPAAIAAAIAKLYGGDSEAFSHILRSDSSAGDAMSNGSHAPRPSDEPFADVQLDTSAFDNPYETQQQFENRQFDSPPQFDGQQAFDESQRFEGQQTFDDPQRFGESASFDDQQFDGQQVDDPSLDGQQSFPSRARLDSMQEFDRELMQQQGFSHGGLNGSYDARSSNGEASRSSHELPRHDASAMPSSPGSTGAAWVPSNDPGPELDVGIARARSSALGDASKLAESLMIIHERTRGSLKSHSVRVARLSYSLCRQLDLSEAQSAQAWAIGLFHDLGKSQQNHLTALNVWQLADYEVTARAQFKNPGRLLKNADVPETVITAILHMYERYDGKGFPDGLSEEAIPFQSRVVALCDSVADLTLNPANTLGRIVSPLEACNHIRAQTPKVFDPTLLAHFSRLLVERKLDGAFLSDQSVHGIEKLLA